MAKAWKISGSIAGIYASIEDPHEIDLIKPLGCISNDGSLVVVYREDLVLKVYQIVGGESKLKDSIDLKREIRATIKADFEKYHDD